MNNTHFLIKINIIKCNHKKNYLINQLLVNFDKQKKMQTIHRGKYKLLFICQLHQLICYRQTETGRQTETSRQTNKKKAKNVESFRKKEK